jgi:hypothetical protein
MKVRLCVALALAGGAMLGCNRKPAPPPASPAATVVTVTANDFSFAAPDSIPAGLTTVKMLNAGKEPHQVVFIRIDSGKTMAEVQTALTTPNMAVPGWMSFPLGANGVLPADSSNATATLAAGHYILVCFMPSPDGTPHVAKGMVKPIEVTASTAAAAPEPAADVVMTAKDYTWDVSVPLTAGAHTIRFENAGPQLHEVQIMQLAPGKTAKDMQTWMAAGMKGEPPARPVGGFAGAMPGGHGFFTATFAAGKYVFLCFVPDSKDYKPHVIHGMMKEITVS